MQVSNIATLHRKINHLLSTDPQALPLQQAAIDEEYILRSGDVRYNVIMYLLNTYFVPGGYFTDEINHLLRLPLDSNDHKEQGTLLAVGLYKFSKPFFKPVHGLV